MTTYPGLANPNTGNLVKFPAAAEHLAGREDFLAFTCLLR